MSENTPLSCGTCFYDSDGDVFYATVCRDMEHRVRANQQARGEYEYRLETVRPRRTIDHGSADRGSMKGNEE